MTPLAHLPKLEDDTFTPATWSRLLTHIVAALDSVSGAWVQAVNRTLTTVRDEHVLARDLVDLRSLLARRAQLSLHPSMPPGARKAFEENLRSEIERFQRELEKAFLGDQTKGRLDSDRDRYVAVIRELPLSAVLNYELKQDGTRLTLAPPPDPGATVVPQPARQRWRHVDAGPDA